MSIANNVFCAKELEKAANTQRMMFPSSEFENTFNYFSFLLLSEEYERLNNRLEEEELQKYLFRNEKLQSSEESRKALRPILYIE